MDAYSYIIVTLPYQESGHAIPLLAGDVPPGSPEYDENGVRIRYVMDNSMQTDDCLEPLRWHNIC